MSALSPPPFVIAKLSNHNFSNFIFLGGPALISMVLLPQRFQIVFGLTGLEAGVRLIAFTLAMPLGTVFASMVAGKLRVAPVHLLLCGTALQVIGFALLGTMNPVLEVPARLYGFQILSGWGCGMNFMLLFVLIPFVNKKEHHCKSDVTRAPPLLTSNPLFLSF